MALEDVTWYVGVRLLLLSLTLRCCKAAESFVSEIEPLKGSLNGGTRITITGNNFARNLFSFGAGNGHLGNKVYLVSSTRNFECSIHLDGCHEKQITCYTPKMPTADYSVRVYVDGVRIPDEEHCKASRNKCIFKPEAHYTPTIDYIEPTSGVPGTLVKYRGRIITSLFGSNEVTSTNGQTARFVRVYMGSDNCEVKNLDEDVLFGIDLDKDGTSWWGALKCKTETTYVGFVNASFIVDEWFGRSMPDLDTLRVSSTGKIYMYQTYAPVTGISPSTGSKRGGTRLTITGMHFDETDAKVNVMVGGTECRVTEPVTDTQIVCETQPAPSAAEYYEGGRGLKFELWNASMTGLDKVSTLTTSDGDYYTRTIDSGYYKDEAGMDRFNTRARGFFVAPRTSEYRFYVMADDNAELYLSTDTDPANKVLMAKSNVDRKYTDDSENQESDLVSLTKDARYYLEVLMNEGSGQAYFQIAARAFVTPYTSSQTAAAWQDTQELQFSSTVIKDTQSVVLTVPTSQTLVKEVQTVTIVGNEDTYFRLGLFGVYSEPLRLTASDGQVDNALASLPSLAPDGVSVQRATEGAGVKFTITFDSERGDFPDLTYMFDAGGPKDCTITIAEKTKGRSPLKHFSLKMDDLPSPSIKVTASADDVQASLMLLFSVRCPEIYNNPPHKYLSLDYEVAVHSLYGVAVSDEEPFCGRFSSKNPQYLYLKDGDSNGMSLSQYKVLCLAYRGVVKYLNMKYQYEESDGDKPVAWKTFNVPTVDDPDKWAYTCIDLYKIATEHRAGHVGYRLHAIKIYRPNSIDDIYVDSVTIVREDTTKDLAGINVRRMKQGKPNGAFVRGLEVTKEADKTYTIAIDPHNCGDKFPLFGVEFASRESGSTSSSSMAALYRTSNNNKNLDVDITRSSKASPPIGGDFRITFKGETTQPIKPSATIQEVEAQLEALGTTGDMRVERVGDCANFKYIVTWLGQPGDQEEVTLTTSALSGNIVNGVVKTTRNGSLWYDPIQGDMLRIISDKPQVAVTVNNVPSLCDGDCTFDWTDAATPEVTAINPAQGTLALNTVLTITGTGFSTTDEDNTVMIGGVACTVTGATATQITCSVGNGPTGSYVVKVNVAGKGEANSTQQFEYRSSATGISPTTGSLAGGTSLTVSGHGFTADAVVKVDNVLCTSPVIEPGKIVCVTPAATSSSKTNVPVTVDQTGATLTSPVEFNFDAAATAVISSISQSSSNVRGGESITISGSGFGASADPANPLTLCGRVANITSYSDTEIIFDTPSNPAGSCVLMLKTGNSGYADTTTNSISAVTYTLKVTNIYPTMGSMYGGTKVTITGQGFVDGDLTAAKVMFGPHKCAVESATATTVICTIADTGVVHDVANTGSDPVFGEGYAWVPHLSQIMEGDSVRFRWTTPEFMTGILFRILQVKNASTTEEVNNGFTSGLTRTANGGYTQFFPNTGHFYYTSDYVDEQKQILARGAVKVKARTSHTEVLNFTIAGYEAMYDTSGSSPTDTSGCPGTSDAISGCTDPEPEVKDTAKFNFKFYSCSSPSVTNISKDQGTTGDVITIEGSGFSDTECQNEIVIGDAVGVVEDGASSTSVSFKINPSKSPEIGKRDSLKFRVGNRGYAKVGNGVKELTFVLLPYVTAVSPSTGSKVGGTKVTITGTGFQGTAKDISVDMEGYSCDVTTVIYTEIVCVTSGTTLGEKTISVTVAAGENNVPAEWMSGVDKTFTFADSETPTVTAVTPTSVSGSSTTITVTGTMFGTDAAALAVKLDESVCTISGSVTDTTFSCAVGDVAVGNHNVAVVVAGKGTAATTVTVESSAVISGVTPSTGSVNGGTVLTINGNGFVVGETTVQVGGEDCVVTAVTPSQVQCDTSSHAAGAVDVVVTSKGTTYPTKAAAFTYDAAATPTFTSVSPNAGVAGDVITVTGTGFSTNAAENAIVINDIKCVVSAATATSATCTLGNQATGTYPIKVVVAGKGATTESTFTYELALTSISPSRGSVAGDQKVTITGKGFVTVNTTVEVCGENCQALDTPDQSATQFVCRTPANDVSSATACDVVASVNGLTSTLASSFTYDPSLTPTITGVSPRRSGTGGGISVTITGTGFGSDSSAVKVSIGGTDCPVSTVSTTEVVCVTERSTSQKTKVRVEVSGNGIAKQVDAAFEYIDVWSAKATWGGKDPPGAGELVVVPKGQILLLDTNTPVLKMLLIQGGELIFDEKDVELHAESILINDGGKLQVGTEDAPFQHKAVITLHGTLRAPELPIYGAKVLAVRNGTLDLHGKPVGVTWTRLASTATAGATTITVEQPLDWSVGDKIVIATTGGRHSQKESEVREITAISADKQTLTLNTALTYGHLGVTLAFNGVSVDTRAEVGLLTHNVVVKGSSNEQWQEKIEACPDGFDTGEFATQTCFQGRFGEEMGSDEYGSQIMIHAPVRDTNIAIARLSYIEVTNAGQAFRLGRYAIHFHLNGDMSQSYVRFCSIHKSNNRAVNVHGSHNTHIEHNVVYDIKGGALFLEDGIETGNFFQYNLAVFVRASTSLLNDDITPASFWVTNPNNTFNHNAAAGGTHFGFWYRMHTNPDGPSKTTAVRCKEVPLGSFNNNSAHSMGWFGIWIFEDYFPTELAVFDGLVSWNNHKGAELVNGGNIQFKNFKVINNEVGIEIKRLVNVNKYDETGPMIKDSLIAGRHADLTPFVTKSSLGISLPWKNGLMLKNLKIENYDRDNLVVFGFSTMQGTCSVLCGGFTVKSTGLTLTNAPRKFRFAWQHEGVMIDLDGSFLGTAGASVLPDMDILPSSQCTAEASCSYGVPAKKCNPGVNFHRFASNNPKPVSLEAKKLRFTNAAGDSVTSDFALKRVTHKPGWMVLLVDGEKYTLTYDDAKHLTNFSYDATAYRFLSNNHLTICQQAERPDRFYIGSSPINETVGGINVNTAVNGAWSFDDSLNQLCYFISHKTEARKKRAAESSEDRILKVNSIKCLHKNCIPPPDFKELNKRPDNALLYSDTKTWDFQDSQKPQANEDVTIPENYWIVADEEAIPTLGTVVIIGALEFDNVATKTFNLRAKMIVVYGRLVIGWPDEPFLGQANIFLSGSHASKPYPVDDGPTAGAKAIAVYGGLDLNGKGTCVTWTSLADTATKGGNKLTLVEAVEWSVGDEILVTSTSYSAWHTETFKISAMSTDKTILTLNTTMEYTHDVMSETLGTGHNYSVSAKVGRFTRNIRVIGETYSGLYTESFGARIMVATSTRNNGTESYSGVAKIKNVEFYLTGQEGYTSSYDPRFSVSFIGIRNDDKRLSYVSCCSFHHGFSPAIGVFGVTGLQIDNNVIHHTVGSAMISDSVNTQILSNLVTLTLWPGSYRSRAEATNIQFDGSIDVMKATSLVFKNNVIAGSERTGIRVRGEDCTSESSWTGNEVHASMIGVSMFPTDEDVVSTTCIYLANLLLWRNYDYGIYYNQAASLKAKFIISIENGIGIFPMVVGPSALSHQTSDKFVEVTNSMFVGQTSSFDCDVHKFDSSDDNFKLSSQARSFAHGADTSMVGLLFPQFTQGSNNAPEKPFISVMSYNAISGIMNIKDNVFARYDASCGTSQNFAITSNKGNDDLQHPMNAEDLTFYFTPKNNRVFYHHPNLGKINPSDCVDMDCDAMKKLLLRDKDGSMLGSPGSILSRSEWEWDGDRRRGLGDYRLPKQMLTDLAGNKINVSAIAPNKGIVRNEQCTFNVKWNAYECHNIDHVMLVIENMDEDTELRRLSPVAVLSNQYVDLVNGPQDHGWCAGYTCQKRLSTFHVLVPNDDSSDVFFTSTTPQVIRLQLLNADNTKSVRVGVWYARRYRLDVYVGSTYIVPNNAEMKGGKFSYKSGVTRTQCLPDPATAKHGDNCMLQDEGMMYVIVRGSEYVEIRTTAQVMVGLTFKTELEFFGEDIVQNLAVFLNVKPSMVRVVSIVRASGARRRRAVTETTVVVEYGDPPGTPAGSVTSHEALDSAAAAVTNAVALGSLTIGPSGSIPTHVTLTEPVPPVASEAWKHVESDTKPITLSKAGRMSFYEPAVEGREGQPFLTPMRLRLYDDTGAAIGKLGTDLNPWQIEATLKKGAGSHASAMLGGMTVVNMTNGWANFTDLYISHRGSDYTVEFKVISPESNFTEVSPALNILKRELSAYVAGRTPTPLEDRPMSLELKLKDKGTNMPLSDIAWRGHTWSVTASMTEGTLTGTKTVSFDPSTGMATFSDLQIDEIGRYYLKFHVTSTPADYDFIYEGYIDISNSVLEATPKDKTSTCQFKFDTNFDPLQSPKDVARFARKWAIAKKDKGIKLKDVTAAQGSVLATLVLEGSNVGVSQAMDDMCKEVEEGEMYSFNGQSIKLMPFMMVDGKNVYGVSCGPTNADKGLSPGIIAAIVLVILLLIIIIVGFLVWKFIIVPKTKTYDSNADIRALGRGKTGYSIEDYLFRDKTSSNIRNQVPVPNAPAATAGTAFSLSVDSRMDMYDDRPTSSVSARSLPQKMPLPSD
ncbi:fibrocystin-L-like isoform X3 [Haliotis rufescens]|uniref:fibrocystin-L-like isoform X3 n=1 Tax=Haliotis rufescens TaxID=6454 RepID=UPI00201E8F38|nr:fibrocystin-L-like isoform X3 [Haliotis rufescens]